MASTIIFLVLAIYLYSFVYPLIKGAVYYPTKKATVTKIVEALGHSRKGKIVDLGSGDGRILVEFARKDINIDGYEINPILFVITKIKLRWYGLDKLAKVYCKSFWKIDLSPYSVVIVFGIQYIMKDLKVKFAEELTPDAIIVSNVFQLPNSKYFKKSGTLYFYRAKDL